MTSDLFSLGRLLTQRELTASILLAMFTKMMAWRTARFGNDLGIPGQVWVHEEGGCWWCADSSGEWGKQHATDMDRAVNTPCHEPWGKPPFSVWQDVKGRQGHFTVGRERRKLRSHLNECKVILLNIRILQCSPISAVCSILTSLFLRIQRHVLLFCYNGEISGITLDLQLYKSR